MCASWTLLTTVTGFCFFFFPFLFFFFLIRGLMATERAANKYLQSLDMDRQSSASSDRSWRSESLMKHHCRLH